MSEQRCSRQDIVPELVEGFSLTLCSRDLAYLKLSLGKNLAPEERAKSPMQRTLNPVRCEAPERPQSKINGQPSAARLRLPIRRSTI